MDMKRHLFLTSFYWIILQEQANTNKDAKSADKAPKEQQQQ